MSSLNGKGASFPALSAIDDAARVRRIAEIAEAIGAVRLRNRALALEARIHAERVYVACIGQVKRGKSSLVNALIGEELLPTGIVPVTAVPTAVRYADRQTASVRFTSGTADRIDVSEIAAFVHEARNPANVRGAESVEVFTPSELLRDGLCLIDTPGLGSIIRGANALTQRIVPHIDAAIIVIGVDPPLAGDELDLIAEIATTVEHLIVVLNKADRFDSADRDAARTFAELAIEERIGRSIGRVLQVSATDRTGTRTPLHDWERLLAALRRLTSIARPRLVRAALARGAQHLTAEALVELAEMGSAIYHPVAEAEDRLEQLRSLIAGAAFDWLSLRHDLERSVAQARQHMIARRGRFLGDAKDEAGYEVARTIAYSTVAGRRALREYAVKLVDHVAHRELEMWTRTEISRASVAEQELGATLLRDAHLAIARATAAATVKGDADLSLDSAGASGSIDLRLAQPDAGPFDAVHAMTNRPFTLPAMALRERVKATFMSRDAFRRAVALEARSLLGQALDEGSEQIQAALLQRLGQLGDQVEVQIRGTLDEMFERADRAVAAARDAHAAGAETARQRLNQLAVWRREVVALRDSPGATVEAANAAIRR